MDDKPDGSGPEQPQYTTLSIGNYACSRWKTCGHCVSAASPLLLQVRTYSKVFCKRYRELGIEVLMLHWTNVGCCTSAANALLLQVRTYSKVFWKRYRELGDDQGEKYIKQIERGEQRIQRQQDIMDAIAAKMDRYRNPWQARFVFPTTVTSLCSNRFCFQ